MTWLSAILGVFFTALINKATAMAQSLLVLIGKEKAADQSAEDSVAAIPLAQTSKEVDDAGDKALSDF